MLNWLMNWQQKWMDFVNICRKALYFRGSLSICPAYAGMILRFFRLSAWIYDLSRVCGDDPKSANYRDKLVIFVPRMRGWSWHSGRAECEFLICPAYAGMILKCLWYVNHWKNLSRVCGDDPFDTEARSLIFKFVPRMRGWSHLRHNFILLGMICPAYAGMIPSAKASSR